MDIRKTLWNKRLFLLAFALPVLIMGGAYLLFGNSSVLVLDLNAQYIQYYEGLKDGLFGDESIFYSWSRNLSGEYMGIIGYYLASPFSIIPILMPRELLVDSILVMELCKAGACGVTFLVYLNKRGDVKASSLPFAVLYALMGYAVVEAMNPMWIDGLIFLPLIFLGLERLVDDGRIVGFIVPLAWLFAANFYIGYMVGIFTILYFFIYCYIAQAYSSLRAFLNKAIHFAIGGAIALACAAVMLLPVYYSLQLGKMEFSDPTISITDKFTLIDFFAKLLPQSYDSVNVEGLPFVYSGVLTVILAPLYFINRKISLRNKLGNAVMLGIVFLCMYISVFDLAMHGFQWPNWLNYRYSFVFSFVLIKVAHDAFVNLSGISLRQIATTCVALFAITVFIESRGYSFIHTTQAIWFTFILLGAYCVLLVLAKRETYRPLLLVLTVVVSSELLLNTYDSFDKINDEVLYSTRSSYTTFVEDNRPVVESLKDYDDSFYRAEKLFHRTVNDPLMLGLYGISHSSSTLNARPIELLRRLGYTSRGHYTKYNGGTIVTDSLLGIKYVLSNTSKPDGYEQVFTENSVTVYENPYAMPLAFLASSDILTMEMDADNPFEAQNQLLNALLGTDNARFFERVEIQYSELVNVNEIDAVDQMRYVPIVAGQDAHIEYYFIPQNENPLYLFLPTKYERKANIWLDGEWVGTYFEGDEYTILPLGSKSFGEEHSLHVTLTKDDLYMQDQLIYSFDTEAFATAIDMLRGNGSTLERESATKLVAQTSSDEDGALYTSIPYEPGWTVTIDGKRTEPIMIADSLMAIEVPAGEHTIVMRFFPKGMVLGMILSALGIAATILLWIMRKKNMTLFSFSSEK